VTVSYRLVQWNRHKRVYDMVLLGAMVAYLAGFLVVTGLAVQPADPMVSLIRATGTLAIVMLHLILMVGPLSRFTTRLAPVLYNRRHAGVLLFFVALAHGALVLFYYGSFGPIDPVRAVFGYGPGIPFEFYGFISLCGLFVMASTSHDFWLANLGHRSWKALHMLVYVAYGSVVLHVAAGAMQDQRDPAFAVLLVLGVVVLVSLHIAAGLKERAKDRAGASPEGGWIEAGAVDDLPMNRARVVCVSGGERVALVRHPGGVSAVSNVCAHQGGPLGEGEVVDGCLTCPWHGYQYEPETGQSPPPFEEKIPTYTVRIVKGRVQVSAQPNEPGTPVSPATDGRTA
jgi:sulfoxide reductase heme-binding subunit YedZ